MTTQKKFDLLSQRYCTILDMEQNHPYGISFAPRDDFKGNVDSVEIANHVISLMQNSSKLVDSIESGTLKPITS